MIQKILTSISVIVGMSRETAKELSSLHVFCTPMKTDEDFIILVLL